MNPAPSPTVQRYDHNIVTGNFDKNPDGDWVKFTDYERVKKQRDELLSAADFARDLLIEEGWEKHELPELNAAITAAEEK